MVRPVRVFFGAWAVGLTVCKGRGGRGAGGNPFATLATAVPRAGQIGLGGGRPKGLDKLLLRRNDGTTRVSP